MPSIGVDISWWVDEAPEAPRPSEGFGPVQLMLLALDLWASATAPDFLLRTHHVVAFHK